MNSTDRSNAEQEQAVHLQRAFLDNLSILTPIIIVATAALYCAELVSGEAKRPHLWVLCMLPGILGLLATCSLFRANSQLPPERLAARVHRADIALLLLALGLASSAALLRPTAGWWPILLATGLAALLSTRPVIAVTFLVLLVVPNLMVLAPFMHSNWLYDPDMSRRTLGQTVILLTTLSLATIAVLLLARANKKTAQQQVALEAQQRTLSIESQEARTAIRAKTQFFNFASHDLRQPLQAARGYLYLVQQQPLDSKARELVDGVERSLDSLDDLMDNLLRVAKLEAQQITVKIATVDISAVLERVALQLTPLAAQKGLDFRLRLRPVPACTDAFQLERMVRNLVTNAIRYTPGKERAGVLLACRQLSGKARVDVYDNGIGISKEDMRAIFHEYFQVDNPERSYEKGLGLGLSVVNGLSRLLDHPVQVNSMLGRGSHFWIEIPLARAMSAPALEEPPGLTDASAVDISKLFVVIIDDRTDSLLSMKGLLEYWQCYPIIAAGSADEALDALSEYEDRFPDLIIADYRLPGGSGIAAIEQIRQSQQAPIPALIVSGDTSPEELQKIAASGFKLLTKPVPAPVLKREIADCVRHLAAIS